MQTPATAKGKDPVSGTKEENSYILPSPISAYFLQCLLCLFYGLVSAQKTE